jgi:hypothetical protein
MRGCDGKLIHRTQTKPAHQSLHGFSFPHKQHFIFLFSSITKTKWTPSQHINLCITHPISARGSRP